MGFAPAISTFFLTVILMAGLSAILNLISCVVTNVIDQEAPLENSWGGLRIGFHASDFNVFNAGDSNGRDERYTD